MAARINHISASLDRIPRLGWVQEPTPVTVLEELAAATGASWIGCKRDDCIPVLHGGNKARKLDFLLAAPPYNTATTIASVGAIGSGHLVATAAAAKMLNKKFIAHLFWEPITEGVIDNLSFTASHAAEIYFFRSRLITALHHPELFLTNKKNDVAIIPAGGTRPVSVLGFVRAGIELAGQIREGVLPLPDHIYTALGTSGTVAGLAIGLALGNIRTTIHAVTTVERPISTYSWLNHLISETLKLLAKNGIHEAKNVKPVPVLIDRSQLGKGYGYPTPAAENAVETFRRMGVVIETVYTGKAAAAMLNDLANGLKGNVLFWNTRRAELPPSSEEWEKKLPASLRGRLGFR